MDNPSPESNSALDINQAAAAFSNLIDPQTETDFPAVDTEIDPPKEDKPEAQAEAPAEDDSGVTIEVDGKTVKLSKAELADAYKNGLRQADYTKKTMEAAEVKKYSEMEAAKARQERQGYADNLNRMAAQLEGVLGQQQAIDMNALLDSDPVEYLKQQHLFTQRQAQLQQINQQRQTVAQQMHAEQQQLHASFLEQQQQELLAKLPGWKDTAKATAEREALKTYLKAEGYRDEDVAGISDHKAVILARKAMLYDQMISKASAAAKKVAAIPQRVERPGVNETPSTDKRSAAYQRLSKSGSISDAAAIFSSIL